MFYSKDREIKGPVAEKCTAKSSSSTYVQEKKAVDVGGGFSQEISERSAILLNTKSLLEKEGGGYFTK